MVLKFWGRIGDQHHKARSTQACRQEGNAYEYDDSGHDSEECPRFDQNGIHLKIDGHVGLDLGKLRLHGLQLNLDVGIAIHDGFG